MGLTYRPPCAKGALPEGRWGIVRQAGGTIPPSRFACHLPLHKGGFIRPTHFRQMPVGTAIGRPRADVVIGPYARPTGALFSRPFALKARGKGDHRRWWKGHLTSLVKDKERKNSHTLPALASPTPPSLSPREGSVRRRHPHADRQGCRSLRVFDGRIASLHTAKKRPPIGWSFLIYRTMQVYSSASSISSYLGTSYSRMMWPPTSRAAWQTVSTMRAP